YPASYLLMTAGSLYVKKNVAGGRTDGHAERVIRTGFYLDGSGLLVTVFVLLPQLILVFCFRYVSKRHVELERLKPLLVRRYGTEENGDEGRSFCKTGPKRGQGFPV